MAIKTEMLRYFVEVAEAGNLASAAKALGRSPAAVSMNLKQFEEELGAPLFQSDRKNQLTLLGDYVLSEAKRELEHFEGTVSSITQFAESGEGQVRAAVITAAGANLMPAVISELHEENANIKVSLEEMPSGAILDAVSSERADFGLLNDFLVPSSSHIKYMLILTHRIGLLCPRDSEIGRKEKLYWSDLANANFINNNLVQALDEPAVKKAVANSRVSTASAWTAFSMVQNGGYVCPLTELGVVSLPADLVFRIPEGKQYERNVYLVWNEDRPPTPATLRVVRIMQKVISDMNFSPKIHEGERFPEDTNTRR